MTATRRHDIDALRVLLFGVLILYHVAMLYVADWDWHLKSSHISEALQYPMLLVNRWRMPLLFLISGLAMNFLQREARWKGGWRMAANRTQRVLLPLVFGALVIVPIQPYCQGIANGLVEPGFGAFLLRYYQFQPWPKDAFDGWEYGFTWNHLWYLAYLWVYSLLLISLLPLLESRAGLVLRRAFTGLRGGWLLLIPGIPKMIALMTLSEAFPTTNDLVHDWYQHALYGSYFLFGWWLGTNPGLWEELKALRHRTLGLAAFNWLAYVLIIQVLLPDDVGDQDWRLEAARLLSGLNTWLWIAAVLGWSATLLNRPFRWLPYATEAVLPWYLLHQSVIVGVAFVLVPMKLGPVIEPLLVIAATVLGCGLLHEFVVRRSGWLRLLFGVKATPNSRSAQAKRNRQRSTAT